MPIWITNYMIKIIQLHTIDLANKAKMCTKSGGGGGGGGGVSHLCFSLFSLKSVRMQ